MSITFSDGHFVIQEDDTVTSIPVGAIASWSELVGEPDPVNVFMDILQVSTEGESGPDPVTQEQAWTETYALLTHRERAREAEAFTAKREGTANDPRSPKLRGMFAARRAIGGDRGEDCALSRCRKNARQKLGIPDPAGGVSDSGMMRVLSTHELGKSNPTGLERAIRDRAEFLNDRKLDFLHSLTGNMENPLDDRPPKVDTTITDGDVLGRYL